MGADPNSVTVSGHSAGCYMSERMMIAHSDSVKGAGLFQCWPYGIHYVDDLFDDSVTAASLATTSIAEIDSALASGEIADTSNLANNSIYIYSGSQDTTTPSVGQ